MAAIRTNLSSRRCGAKPDHTIAVICNWTPLPRADYCIGIPKEDRWTELLNSDDTRYGGVGLGNREGVRPLRVPLDGYPYSFSLTLPPLSMLWHKPTPTKRRRAPQPPGA